MPPPNLPQDLEEPAGPRGYLPLLQALAVNAVPILGVYRFGWSASTALALYWFENLLGALLVALRILLHRHWTHAPGYAHNPFKVTIRSGDGPARQVKGFLPAFMMSTVVFTLVHGIFLAFLLFALLPGEGAAPLDPAALKRGLLTLSGVLSLYFLIDLIRLRRRSFAWVRDLTERLMRRMLVVHLTIIFGMGLLAWLHKPAAFFGVFMGLKLLFDIFSSLPRAEVSTEAPGCLAWTIRTFKPGTDPQKVWQDTLKQQKDLEAADETPPVRPRRR